MFPKRKRLSREGFRGVGSSQRISSPHFSIAYPRHESGYAVVVGKTVDKKSVGRHLVKRRVLAVLRSLSLPKALVIFAKPSAGKLSFEEIKTELTELMSRVSG